MQADTTLDTFGLFCPVPIMKTAAEIKNMAAGQILEVLADDEQILEDMPAWCRSMGHELLDVVDEDGEYRLYVKKGGKGKRGKGKRTDGGMEGWKGK